MDFLPIPYFGMIVSLIVLPTLTFGFILLMKKIRADVDKMKYKKEMMELELKKEEVHLQAVIEENKKLSHLIEGSKAIE